VRIAYGGWSGWALLWFVEWKDNDLGSLVAVDEGKLAAVCADFIELVCGRCGDWKVDEEVAWWIWSGLAELVEIAWAFDLFFDFFLGFFNDFFENALCLESAVSSGKPGSRVCVGGEGGIGFVGDRKNRGGEIEANPENAVAVGETCQGAEKSFVWLWFADFNGS